MLNCKLLITIAMMLLLLPSASNISAKALSKGAYICGGAPCQLFFLQNDRKTLCLREKGTVVGTLNRNFVLLQGKFFAIVHDLPVTVSTPLATFDLPAETSFIAEVTSYGVVRLAVMDTREKSTVSMNANDRFERLELGTGEELCLCATEAELEEIIPVDGVSRHDTTSQRAGKGKVVRCKFNRIQMLEKEKLLVCNMGKMHSAKRALNKFKDQIFNASE